MIHHSVIVSDFTVCVRQYTSILLLVLYTPMSNPAFFFYARTVQYSNRFPPSSPLPLFLLGSVRPDIPATQYVMIQLTMDRWDPGQMTRMELGGNGQLRAWFIKCQTENSEVEMKYRTKAATLYR